MIGSAIMKVPAKTTKLYAAGLFLLVLALLVFAQAAFELGAVGSEAVGAESDRPALDDFDVYLPGLIGFWLHLASRRRQSLGGAQKQKPGSKFKTRVLVSLVGLTLIPAACLFAFAYGLVNRSISKWFSVPVDQIFDAADDMSEEWQHDRQAVARSILNYHRPGNPGRPRQYPAHLRPKGLRDPESRRPDPQLFRG